METANRQKLNRTDNEKAIEPGYLSRFEHVTKILADVGERKSRLEQELDKTVEVITMVDLKTAADLAAKMGPQEEQLLQLETQYYASAQLLAKIKREWRKEIIENSLTEAKHEKQKNLQDALRKKYEASANAIVSTSLTRLTANTKTSSSNSDGVSRNKWDIPSKNLEVDQANPLGSGQFGTVYRAKLLGKEVAVKVLNISEDDEEAIEEFIKEVNIMVSLRHPNIILFIGACTEPGKLSVITEVMSKGSVADIIHPKKSNTMKVTLKRKMLIAKETAQGMNYLHQTEPPIVHLDLKPANLLVDENWIVKVADFGLSTVRNQGYSVTMDNAIGSPMYMSPEMMVGKKTGMKSDVYSFGIILWEMYTEKVPYNNRFRSFNELCEAIAFENERPPMPTDIPDLLRRLITSCWDAEPPNRPSFQQMISTNIFDEIILEGMISNVNKCGRQVWKECFFEKYCVDWKDFLGGFVSSVGIQFDSSNSNEDFEKCLKNALGSETDQQVNIENYSSMLEWVGPFNFGQEIFEKIINLYSKPWFHGNLSVMAAESILSMKRKKGSFLVRFGHSEPGAYALSFVAKDESIQHIQITHKPGQNFVLNGVEFASLDEIIGSKALKSMKPRISLKYAVPAALNPQPLQKPGSLRDTRKSMRKSTISGPSTSTQ